MQPCVIAGCTNTGIDDSNKYRQSPVLCEKCKQDERSNWSKPRKCSFCSRRRKCTRTLEGELTCRDCLYDDYARKEHERRMAHSHAIKSVTMMFDRGGAPHTIRASTHCSWTAHADLDMVDGVPTYIILSDQPVALFYDAAQATCPNCRRNADREDEQRQAKAQIAGAITEDGERLTRPA